jgi:NTP pyrophosphatase (non-canonical NTP hydrolase)
MDLTADARFIAESITESGHFPESEAKQRQVIALAEEAGEFVGAARRYMGMARRNGTFEEMEDELADVIITGYVTAHVFGSDLNSAIHRKLIEIYSRGWKNE